MNYCGRSCLEPSRPIFKGRCGLPSAKHWRMSNSDTGSSTRQRNTPTTNTNPGAATVAPTHPLMEDALTPDQLKAWRTRMGWTQKKAAEELGISKRHYQMLEAGGSPVTPTLSKLIAFLEAA